MFLAGFVGLHRERFHAEVILALADHTEQSERGVIEAVHAGEVRHFGLADELILGEARGLIEVAHAHGFLRAGGFNLEQDFFLVGVFKAAGFMELHFTERGLVAALLVLGEEFVVVGIAEFAELGLDAGRIGTGV